MYRFILGINSFWLLFPLYTISFSVNYLLYIHTILTSFISALYWFLDYNRILHNIDRINAILYFFHLFYNANNINILYLFVILFYGLSHYLENKKIESLFAHLSFRKCGFCIVYLQLVNKPENLYMIIMLYYLHLYYLFIINDNNIIKRTIELFIYKFLIIYVSSNVYPILR
jgi:hypothetical protein